MTSDINGQIVRSGTTMKNHIHTPNKHEYFSCVFLKIDCVMFFLENLFPNRLCRYRCNSDTVFLILQVFSFLRFTSNINDFLINIKINFRIQSGMSQTTKWRHQMSENWLTFEIKFLSQIEGKKLRKKGKNRVLKMHFKKSGFIYSKRTYHLICAAQN